LFSGNLFWRRRRGLGRRLREHRESDGDQENGVFHGSICDRIKITERRLEGEDLCSAVTVAGVVRASWPVFLSGLAFEGAACPALGINPHHDIPATQMQQMKSLAAQPRVGSAEL
jgi:hypothetical protein